MGIEPFYFIPTWEHSLFIISYDKPKNSDEIIRAEYVKDLNKTPKSVRSPDFRKVSGLWQETAIPSADGRSNIFLPYYINFIKQKQTKTIISYWHKNFLCYT